MALKSPYRGIQAWRKRHDALSAESGRKFFVDATGGNDANDGRTPNTAWQTIGKVNGETFVAGDSVLFKRGETWAGTQLTLSWSGSAQAPIIFADYGSGNKPIIDGNDAVTCISATNQDFLYLKNIECTQGVAACIALTTCTHLTLMHCDAHDQGNDGIVFVSCSYCLVWGGEFYNGYQGVVGAIIAGIEVGDNCHDITVINVVSHDQGGAGAGISIHSHALTEMPYNITIRNSSFYSNANHGINILKQDATTDTNRNILIEDCLVYGNIQEGIRISHSAGEFINGVTIRDTVTRNNTRYAIYNQGKNILLERMLIHEGRMLRHIDGDGLTVYNCTYYLTTWVGYPCMEILTSGNTANIVVKNCILASADSAAYLIIFAAGTTTGADVDYNLYYNTGDLTALTRFTWGGAGKNWTTWLTDSGQDANSPTPSNPLFTDAGSDDYTLQSGSPAINAGVNIGLSYCEAAPDCGAYEYCP